jgi:hypothetical protein
MTRLDSVDIERSKSNPWGLTAHQCAVLRMVSETGCTKRACREYDVNARNVEHHLMVSRRQMGMYGNDIRLFLIWDRWVRGVQS